MGSLPHFRKTTPEFSETPAVTGLPKSEVAKGDGVAGVTTTNPIFTSPF